MSGGWDQKWGLASILRGEKIFPVREGGGGVAEKLPLLKNCPGQTSSIFWRFQKCVWHHFIFQMTILKVDFFPGNFSSGQFFCKGVERNLMEGIQDLWDSIKLTTPILLLRYEPHHLTAARCTHTSDSMTAILGDNLMSIFHRLLGPFFYTVCFHFQTEKSVDDK